MTVRVDNVKDQRKNFRFVENHFWDSTFRATTTSASILIFNPNQNFKQNLPILKKICSFRTHYYYIISNLISNLEHEQVNLDKKTVEK